MSMPTLRIQSGMAIHTSPSGRPDENDSSATAAVRQEPMAWRRLPSLPTPLSASAKLSPSRIKERETNREHVSPSSPCLLALSSPEVHPFHTLVTQPISRGWGKGRQHIETQAVCQFCSHVRA